MAEIDLIARRLAELDERVLKIESLENGLWKLKEDMEYSKRYLARRRAKPRRSKPRRAKPCRAKPAAPSHEGRGGEKES